MAKLGLKCESESNTNTFSFSLNKQSNRGIYFSIVVEYQHFEGPSVCILEAIPTA
jgi:hypothetical protein